MKRLKIIGVFFLLSAALLVGSLLYYFGYLYNPFSRYAELTATIKRHTGFAHLTRGVNVYTIQALDAVTTEQDIPILKEMINDETGYISVAAREVLLIKENKNH